MDLSKVDATGFVAKAEVADLLNIQDPQDLNGDGSTIYKMPFVTIENVVVLDSKTILVANDNNYPFSLGRPPAIDNTEIVTLELSTPLNVDKAIFSNAGKTVLQGGSGDDVLVGTNGDDEINAGAGNNTLHGLLGNNTLIAGNGNDTAYAEGGDDVFLLGNGNNTVFANAGSDRVSTGSGNDTIYADLGDDWVNAGDGNNIVFAREGNNRVTTGLGNDIVWAGMGNNSISTGAGDDLIYVSGGGINTINAGIGNDTIIKGWTGNGVDTIALNAGAGSVTIFGFDSNDKITRSSGLVASDMLTITKSEFDTTISKDGDLLATLKWYTGNVNVN